MNLACCCTEHGLTLAAALSTFLQALIHGLNRHYYSLAINYRKTPLEERMLGNLQASCFCTFSLRHEALNVGSAHTSKLLEERMLGKLLWCLLLHSVEQCAGLCGCCMWLGAGGGTPVEGPCRHFFAVAATFRGAMLVLDACRIVMGASSFALLPHMLQKHTWTKGLSLRNFEDHAKANAKLVEEIRELSSEF